MKKILTSLTLLFSIALFSADLAGEMMKKSFVTVPAGEHTLSRTVEVSGNLTVILENGAVIKASCDPMFRIKGGEFRMEGRGLPGKLVSTAEGKRGYSVNERGTVFDLNHADGKTPLRLNLRNLSLQATNGVDAYHTAVQDKRDVEEIRIADCTFRCTEKAIAAQQLTIGSVQIENCKFEGGDNPVFLNVPAPGGMVIRGNTLRDFGRVGIHAGKSGQIADGCTTHLPDTIIHDNRLIGGGHGSTIRDAYIHGILVYGNNVSVQGNIVRNVNRGEPIPGKKIGQQIRMPDGSILQKQWIEVNGVRQRLAGAAIYLKANRALVQGNICTNSGWRSVIEIKTGAKEFFVSVVNNVVDGQSLNPEESFGFECASGRSLWAGNLVYDMPNTAFVVRSGFENSFLNNLIVNAKIGFSLSGWMPGQNELVAGNRFIDVEHPVALPGNQQITEGCGEDILLPSTAKISDQAELPDPSPKWHGRQIVRGDKVYLCIRQGKDEYRWMELQGKVLPIKQWKTVGPEMVFNADQSGREQSGNAALNDPRYPGWMFECLSAGEKVIPEKEWGLAPDTQVFRTGDRSLKVIFPNVSASWRLKQPLKLKPRRRYRATAVVKGEEANNLRLEARPSGSYAVISRAQETKDWQILTVDFVQTWSPDCLLSVWSGKNSPGKAAWVDSVSVRELQEDRMASQPKVDTVGDNRIKDDAQWVSAPAGGEFMKDKAGLHFTPGDKNAYMLCTTLDLEPNRRWLLRVDTDEPVICMVFLPGGEKITQKKDEPGWLEFTTPDRTGKTGLRIWVGGCTQGSPILLRSVQLHQLK